MTDLTDPGTTSTIASMLYARRSDDLHGYHVTDGEQVRKLSFADAWRRSQAMAGVLREALSDRPAGPTGAGVLVTTDEPLDFIAGFFGALLVGAHPVPVPAPLRGHTRHRERVLAICDSSHAVVAVVPEPQVPLVQEFFASNGRQVAVHAVPDHAPPVDDSAPAVERGAYWQFSSGTSGTPTRVTLDDATVLAHLEQAADVYDEDSSCVSVNWVPLHHDMGLVTSVLRPLHSGYDSVMIPPERFVVDPQTWPAMLTRFSATHTSAPDFGYALCARKARDPERFDLSGLRVARVAGELVRASTLQQFTDVFAASGFRYDAFAPSYGMAEATLTVTTCAVDERPSTIWVKRDALAADRIVPTSPDEPDAVEIVSCGRPLPGTTVTIVTRDRTEAAAAMSVGEVHIAGPQVVLDPTPDLVGRRAGRLTGDFGFVVDDELFLLGRSRERFQVNGENHYLPDIESVVHGAADTVRPGRAFVAPTSWTLRPGRGVVVVAELVAQAVAQPETAMAETGRRLIAAVARRAGLTVDTLHLVVPGSIPLTSSGKLQRHGTDQLLTIPPLWSFNRKDGAPS